MEQAIMVRKPFYPSFHAYTTTAILSSWGILLDELCAGFVDFRSLELGVRFSSPILFLRRRFGNLGFRSGILSSF